MKRLFLVITVGCLLLFVVAGLVVGELIPFSGQGPHSYRARRTQGPSFWAIIQNVSAVLGIVAFLIQIFQWRKKRD